MESSPVEGGENEDWGTIAARIGNKLNDAHAYLTANAETLDSSIAAQQEAVIEDIYGRWKKAVEDKADMATLQALNEEAKAAAAFRRAAQ